MTGERNPSESLNHFLYDKRAVRAFRRVAGKIDILASGLADFLRNFAKELLPPSGNRNLIMVFR
jgi:hypothetical protein